MDTWNNSAKFTAAGSLEGRLCELWERALLHPTVVPAVRQDLCRLGIDRLSLVSS